MPHGPPRVCDVGSTKAQACNGCQYRIMAPGWEDMFPSAETAHSLPSHRDGSNTRANAVLIASTPQLPRSHEYDAYAAGANHHNSRSCQNRHAPMC